MNLFELQNKIHAQNKEMGWWDNPRSFSTFVCLFHSELSEAMEGDRKGLKDDHLPHYEMFWVEIADFVIRCLDFTGSCGMSEEDHKARMDDFNKDTTWKSFCRDRVTLIAELHSYISDEYEVYNSKGSSPLLLITGAIHLAYAFAIENGVDLTKIILEKVEYNKHRADHKRENRAKDGGKKY